MHAFLAVAAWWLCVLPRVLFQAVWRQAAHLQPNTLQVSKGLCKCKHMPAYGDAPFHTRAHALNFDRTPTLICTSNTPCAAGGHQKELLVEYNDAWHAATRKD